MNDPLEIRPAVAAALASGDPVVALESTVIAHGLPVPRNLEVAERLEEIVRDAGATPATVGLVDGRAVIGLTRDQIRMLAASRTSGSDGPPGGAETEEVAKVSLPDIGAVLAGGRRGATTVAATAHLAARAGIRVFSTGGIGGVHRGGETSLDISADLFALAHTPIAVVCAGAKAILDLGRTLEVLETLGVPVVGYRTREFPAFYTRESGLRLEHQVESPEEAAHLVRAHWQAGLETGVVLCNPPPAESALLRAEVDAWIARADGEAANASVHGKVLTPWLLARLADLSGGRTVESNVALLEDNARLAAGVAVALAT